MKKVVKGFLFAFLLLALGACSSKYAEYSYVSDYTKYVQSGFFIYPVGTDVKEASYIPVAEIQMTFYTGKKTKNVTMSDLSTIKLSNGDIVYVPTIDHATEKMVESAKKYGANAIVNYQVIANRTSGGGIISYRAKGVAVKIAR
jgi:hypothetical protein